MEKAYVFAQMPQDICSPKRLPCFSVKSSTLASLASASASNTPVPPDLYLSNDVIINADDCDSQFFEEERVHQSGCGYKIHLKLTMGVGWSAALRMQEVHHCRLVGLIPAVLCQTCF